MKSGELKLTTHTHTHTHTDRHLIHYLPCPKPNTSVHFSSCSIFSLLCVSNIFVFRSAFRQWRPSCFQSHSKQNEIIIHWKWWHVLFLFFALCLFNSIQRRHIVLYQGVLFILLCMAPAVGWMPSKAKNGSVLKLRGVHQCIMILISSNWFWFYSVSCGSQVFL